MAARAYGVTGGRANLALFRRQLSSSLFYRPKPANMASHLECTLAGQASQLVISDGSVRQNRRKRNALRFDGYAVVPDRSGARQPHQGRREHAPGSRVRERTHFRNGIFTWRAALGTK